ncbi:MAG: LCP family protein [Liquorilactobacillus ghanensis]|uniref:LCP family protein n=1 Tax=Liquorilactobacillus ghanensis TaxID=399370 RepID=UPI0039EC6230
MNDEELTDLRRSRNHHPQAHHHRGCMILILFLILLIGGGWLIWRHLNPTSHFSDLKTVSNSTSKVKQSSGTFNVLVIGSDERKNQTDGHTDSMMLVHANLKTHQYHVLSIPRDSRIYMPGLGYTKLTSVQTVYQTKYGAKKGIFKAVQTISSYLNVPINYYLETNYMGFRSMVDAVNGINMDVPFNVTLTHPWYAEDQNKVITKGQHKLNGKMVTEIVHERDSVPGTDFGRQQLQETALVAIINKITDPVNAFKIPALANSMSKFLVATNMSKTDMISIGLAVKDNFDATKQVHYLQLQGKNEVLYDDILENYNDEIVLQQSQLKKIIDQNFSN